ncbi:LPXTG cell wall anchor domain-containing protein [Candidatus Saccharibacteria bacterium]|nr:LPXTG cell wall anchor domain-containing protein [Candidatus Saccharibacteria bacterium]
MVLTYLKNIFSVFTLSFLILIATSAGVSAVKVNLTPASVTLVEGQSQVVTVTLDEPIICPVMDETCLVQIDVSSNTPDRVSITSSPVIFKSDQWFQPLTFTVTATDDSLDNGDVSPLFALPTTSNSEYYSGFNPSFTLGVTDNDEPQTIATSSPTSTKPQLPATGTGTAVWALTATILLVLSGTLMTWRKKTSHIHTKYQ